MIEFSYLHSFFQRSRPTDKQWSNQSRVGVFNRVDSWVVQVGQAVGLLLHWPRPYGNRPLVGVHWPRPDQGSWRRGHHSWWKQRLLQTVGFHAYMISVTQGLSYLAAFSAPSVSSLCTTLCRKRWTRMRMAFTCSLGVTIFNLATFGFVVIERPVLIHAVLDTMWLHAVRSAGFVLKDHIDGVLLFSSEHRTY